MILLAGTLFSCSTTQEILVTEKIVINDEVYLPSVHEHVCDSSGCYCFYLEETTFELTDTLELEYYIIIDKKNKKK